MFSLQLSFLWCLYVGECAFMYFKNAITYVYLHILLFLLNHVSWTSLHVSICTHVIFVKGYIVFVHQCEYKPIYLPSFLLHLGHVIPFFFFQGEGSSVWRLTAQHTDVLCPVFLAGLPRHRVPGTSPETRPCDMCERLEDFLCHPSRSIYSRDLLEKLQLEENYTCIRILGAKYYGIIFVHAIRNMPQLK